MLTSDSSAWGRGAPASGVWADTPAWSSRTTTYFQVGCILLFLLNIFVFNRENKASKLKSCATQPSPEPLVMSSLKATALQARSKM